jgi:hypothetical protein
MAGPIRDDLTSLEKFPQTVLRFETSRLGFLAGWTGVNLSTAALAFADGIALSPNGPWDRRGRESHAQKVGNPCGFLPRDAMTY